MNYKREVTPQKMFIFVMIVIGVGIYCIASGVWGVTENRKQSLNQVFTQSFDKGDLFEGSVEAASPTIMEIDHSINYLIPVGKEYYYLILSDDYSTAITIRADKNFGKSFDSNLKSTENVIIKGRIKKLPYQVRSRLNEVKDTFAESGLELHIIEKYYIDTIGGNLYKIRITVGICILLVVILCYSSIKRNELANQTVFGKIMLIIVIASILVILIWGTYIIIIK